jgi:hypothetical protein
MASAKEGFVMTFKAKTTIKKGEPITVCYSNPFKTVLERQSAISQKLFMVIMFFFTTYF